MTGADSSHNRLICGRTYHRGQVLTLRAESAICLDPPPGELAEPITLRDKLACVWKQLLAARHKLASPLIFDP
jgi:hypothetical protein